MSYALTILWNERLRFLPGVLAVAFSALLVSLQTGLLLGMFSFTSRMIDETHADIWVAGPEVESVENGIPIPETYLGRVAVQPEVARCELYMQGFRMWVRPDGGSQLCTVIGCRLEDGALGAVPALTPELRCLLSEPGSVVVDAGDLERMGIKGVGDYAEVDDRRVRVVGLIHGLRGFLGVSVICSIPTARALLAARTGNDVRPGPVLQSGRRPGRGPPRGGRESGHIGADQRGVFVAHPGNTGSARPRRDLPWAIRRPWGCWSARSSPARR